MKKLVLKLNYSIDKTKQRVMRKASGIPGLESLSLDPKDKRLTLTGDIDPVEVVEKLRKVCSSEIVSFELGKEPEKKKEEGNKDDKSKKDQVPEWLKIAYQQQAAYNAMAAAGYYYQPLVMGGYFHHNRSVEEDPSSCVIS